MSTPHNEAGLGDFAKTVLMPGDPLRAKVIAETFLENCRQVTGVRGMLGYTGEYRGKEISVMGSGMGMPSIGIYSYELYQQYGVERIIRIGSAGAYVDSLNLYDVVLAENAWSESSFAKTQSGYEADLAYPSQELNAAILAAAKELGIAVTPARIHSTDVFYRESNMGSFTEFYEKHQCACVEMESFALFHNAAVLNKQAACLLTISDSFVTAELATAEERQHSFVNMMKVALEAGTADF